ncbi:LysM peptidoglycan-binding domain-containing protein [Ruminiclostridium cellobioparum]|uniref:LysM peptidoglycan-binding domain-containing protein n=1 Tax=Ruminiclostridium cellobioparum TaxID=29355 RepID=UPI0004830CB6|nr:LysM peptidoglycan-binding domain-containing protein [Ruminiclostridium cellobioparum]
MDGNVRLSATVISCMGNDSEQDDFYFNGSFSNCHSTQSIQLSFEKAANNYVFAISDSMGLEDGDFNGISAIREIKKYHESAKIQQFSLETISERIYEAVQLSSNLIYSKSVIASQNSTRLTGFSSLIIDNNRAAVMNLGNNGAFLFRQGVQKDIFSRNNGRKTEKLRSLGINPTMPDLLNDTEQILKLAEEESKTKIKLSPSFELEEDDLIILCSDGLLNGITRSRLEAVVDAGFDPSKMASVLYQEALKSGLEDGITIMVIKVDEIRSLAFGYGNRRINPVGYENETEGEEEEEHKESNIVNYILGFVCVLVISGVLFMGYLILSNSGIFGSDKDNNTSQASMTTNSQEDSADLTQNGGDDAENSDAVETSTASVDSQGGRDNSSSGNGSGNNSPGSQQGNSGQNANYDYDTYIVKSGDTFSGISKQFYGDFNKYNIIMEFNNIKKDNSLYVGQELKIPKIK